MKVEQFFKEWISTRPNLKAEFHDAGIEAMAFADAYHKKQLFIYGVGNHVFCPYCGYERQLKVETALNSGRVCKNRLCKGR